MEETTVTSVSFTNIFVKNANQDNSNPSDGIVDLLSDTDLEILQIAFYVILTGAVSVFGVIANIINIIVFVTSGLKDTVNISLLGLAVSDLGALLTLIWMGICMNPLFRYSNLPFESMDIQYITAGWPHVCFARITSWITAFVAFERCVCVVLPLKVKNILTVKKTTIVVVFIFVVMIISVSPAFFSLHFVSKYFPERNKTLIGQAYYNGGLILENIAYNFSVFAQLSSFIVVIICTATLIQNILWKSQWRKATLSISSFSTTDISASRRDKRVVKMVTIISCIFIICFLPNCVNIILILSFSPEYNFDGQYQNSFFASWAILSTLEATNSSINIFVYYSMSSRYRDGFDRIFRVSARNIQYD